MGDSRYFLRSKLNDFKAAGVLPIALADNEVWCLVGAEPTKTGPAGKVTRIMCELASLLSPHCPEMALARMNLGQWHARCTCRPCRRCVHACHDAARAAHGVKVDTNPPHCLHHAP